MATSSLDVLMPFSDLVFSKKLVKPILPRWDPN